MNCFRKTIDQRRALPHHEVFLIAENDLMSYGELQDEIGRYVHGDQWTTLRVPKPVAKAGAWAKEKLSREDEFIKPWMVDLADQHYPVEIAKAQEKLGWKPSHTLRGTLPDMIASLQRDPDRWYDVNGLQQPEGTLF